MINVITPVDNGDRFIEACIKVVIETYRDLEHFTIDGGATDRTRELLKLKKAL
ncbi:MAG: hypothetical protein ACR2LR_11410 [Hassallia sp.]